MCESPVVGQWRKGEFPLWKNLIGCRYIPCSIWDLRFSIHPIFRQSGKWKIVNREKFSWRKILPGAGIAFCTVPKARNTNRRPKVIRPDPIPERVPCDYQECRGRELNPHGLWVRGILSPLRLPSSATPARRENGLARLGTVGSAVAVETNIVPVHHDSRLAARGTVRTRLGGGKNGKLKILVVFFVLHSIIPCFRPDRRSGFCSGRSSSDKTRR